MLFSECNFFIINLQTSEGKIMGLFRTSLKVNLERIGESVGSGASIDCGSLADRQRDVFRTSRSQGKPQQDQRREVVMDTLSYTLSASMLLVAIIAIAAIGNACATTSLASLEGTWRLVSVNSKRLEQLPADQVPYFKVTGIMVSGFDGCNSFDGRIDQPGNISSTRRGCLENTIKLPLDLGDFRSQLKAGTINKNSLSMPAYGQFPAAMFERSE